MTTADELSEQKRAAMSPLRWERVRRGLTLREAATAMGIASHTQLSSWEDGHASPLRSSRERLAAFYGTTVTDLFGADSTPPVAAKPYVERQRPRLVSVRPKETVYPEPVGRAPRTLSRFRQKLEAMSHD